MGQRRLVILAIAVAAAVNDGVPILSAAQAQTQQPPAAQVQPQVQPQGQPGPSPVQPEQGPGSPPAAIVPGVATTLPAATQPAAARPAAPDVAGDLRMLRETLLRAEARQLDRDEAAARLASRHADDADAILLDVLTNGPRDARLAVARAVADDPSPAAAMIPPLADLLRLGAEQRSAAVVDAAAAALACYRRNPQALDALLRFVNDPDQPAAARAQVARALGRVVDPAAASALVALLRSDRASLRSAAAEALAELTGIREFGANPARWEQWQRAAEQAANADLDAWRAALLEAKAAQLERLRRRHGALVDAAGDRMFERYQAAPREQRPEVLLTFLGSAQPDERAAGARLVPTAFRAGDPVTEPVYARLVVMVGDSDAGVREVVAVALRNLNYRPALPAILTQLAQERDVRVKVALAEALAPIEDPAAAPQLAALLNDPSAAVVTAAANAIARTAAQLRRTDPALAGSVGRRLESLAASPRVATDLRVAALDALGALQIEESVIVLAQRLLAAGQPEPPVQVRQAALRALGALGKREAGDIIFRALTADREPDVRLAALDALARVGTVGEHGALLLDYTRRERELNEAVRQKAWAAYQVLLSRASAEDLSREKAVFRNEPERLVSVLEELCRKLEQSPRPQDKQELANQRVALGEAYMKHKPPRPDKAVPPYRGALDYYLQAGAAEATTTPLIEQLMDAHLESRDYGAATAFAAEMIRLDPRHKEIVGPAIKNEVDELRLKGDTAAALQLANYALKMDPALDERHLRDLRQIRQEIEGSPAQ